MVKWLEQGDSFEVVGASKQNNILGRVLYFFCDFDNTPFPSFTPVTVDVWRN
jgi:hypothetical protein